MDDDCGEPSQEDDCGEPSLVVAPDDVLRGITGDHPVEEAIEEDNPIEEVSDADRSDREPDDSLRGITIDVMKRHLEDALMVMETWSFDGKYMRDAAERASELKVMATRLLTSTDHDVSSFEKEYAMIEKKMVEMRLFIAQAGEHATPTKKARAKGREGQD